MHHLSLQHRTLAGRKQSGVGDKLVANLAESLAQRQVYGPVAIVCDNPSEFLAALQIEWLAATAALTDHLDSHPDEIATNRLQLMRHCSFSIKPPIEESSAWVQIATIDDFLKWPPNCRTMYVTNQVTNAQLHQVTAWMPPYGEVVMYRSPKN